MKKINNKTGWLLLIIIVVSAILYFIFKEWVEKEENHIIVYIYCTIISFACWEEMNKK